MKHIPVVSHIFLLPFTAQGEENIIIDKIFFKRGYSLSG